MNLVEEKTTVSLIQEAGRIDDEAGLRRFPERVRDVYGLKHVSYAATGIAFGQRIFLASTYPDDFPRWYDDNQAQLHDPIMKSVVEGRPTLWHLVEPKDEFGSIIMERRRSMIGSSGLTLPIMSSDESTALISYVDGGCGEAWSKGIAVLMRELKQVGGALHRQALQVMGIAPQEIRMSKRHIHIIQLLAAGMNEFQIANVLEISERTVKQHILEAKTRLRCRTKAHLVAMAISQGYLDLNAQP